MIKHKLGLVGTLREMPDGTIALTEPGRFSYAFQVQLADVVSFAESRLTRTQNTLHILGVGGEIATATVGVGTAAKLNAWLATRRRDGDAPDPRERVAPSAPSSASSAPSSSLADDLERIAGLHARGVLTDAEFAAAKARLLG